MDVDIRPTNPRASPNKMIYYKTERLIQNLMAKLKIRRNCDILELYLANESIVDVPPLEHFKNLTRLWLHNNRIKRLEFFQRNEALSEIYLQNNLIQDIENCFRNLPNIRILFLNGNQLSNLKSTVNELSYLMNLENLNLFDNPIALENDYRPFVINNIQSLKFLDRNMISNEERLKVFNKYNKNILQTRIGFLRHVPVKNSQLPEKSKKHVKIYQSQILDDYQIKSQEPRQYTHRNSIKEFSYFDWSKVKLYQNKFKQDEIQTKETELEIENFEELITSRLKAQESDLPQVITVRIE